MSNPQFRLERNRGGEYPVVTDGGYAASKEPNEEASSPTNSQEACYGAKRARESTSGREDRNRRRKRKLRQKVFWTDREGKLIRRHHMEEDHVERPRREKYKDIPENQMRSTQKREERNRKRTMRLRIQRSLQESEQAAGCNRNTPAD